MAVRGQYRTQNNRFRRAATSSAKLVDCDGDWTMQLLHVFVTENRVLNLSTHETTQWILNAYHSLEFDRLCGLVFRVPGCISRGPGSIPGATRFFRSSGFGTGSTQPREYNWGPTWKKKYRSLSRKSRLRPEGILRADYATPLYLQKLALTSATNCGRSVGLVRSRTKATKLVIVFLEFLPRFIYIANFKWNWILTSSGRSTHICALKCNVRVAKVHIFVHLGI
jgi:hypothetical protein